MCKFRKESSPIDEIEDTDGSKKVKNLRNPFVVTKEKITISGSLNDRDWSAYGNSVLSATSQSRSCTFDLVNCWWADPIPLMSLVLHANHLSRNGVRITIRINSAVSVNSRFRFPVFFVEHGFLKIAREFKWEVIDKNGCVVSDEEEKQYLTKRNVLSYPDPSIIEAVLINIDGKKRPGKLARQLVDKVRESYDHLIHRTIYTGLLYRTQVALEETFFNIFEHAYIDSSYTPAFMVFARFRRGFDRLDSIEIPQWREAIERESKQCPFLLEQYLLGKEGCIELFVVDNGIGIFESFRRSDQEIENRKSIRSLLQRIFTVGASTRKDKRADAGGLTVIHNQMIPNRDYVRLFDSGVWYGVPGSLNRPNRTIEEVAAETGSEVRSGLAWTLRLGLRGDIQPNLDWVRVNGDSKEKILNVYTASRLPKTGAQEINIFDNRLEELTPDKIPDYRSGNIIIWLPQPNLGKDDVRSMYGWICKRLANTSEWSVVIADIRTHEGTVYYDALSGRADRTDGHVRHIVLLTERLQGKALTRKVDRLNPRFDNDVDKEEKLLTNAEFVGEVSIVGVLSALRNHDSMSVWREANDLPGTFIQEYINWGKHDGVDHVLCGYLNVEVLQRSAKFKALARVGLERLVSLKTRSDPGALVPVDNLVSDVCDDFNSIGDRYGYTNATRVHVGSIYVTGKTVRSGHIPLNNMLHLFRHMDSSPEPTGDHIETVFCWNSSESLAGARSFPNANSCQYERVGTSHSISKLGRNHYVIPKRCSTGYYASRSPRQFFEDIQNIRASAVRVGHWVYRNNHDILGLNIRLFIRNAFDRRNDLAQFLIKNLMIEAGFTKSGFRSVVRKAMDEKLLQTKRSRRALIVYPSHPVTEKIVAGLLKFLTPNGYEKHSKQFIPVRRLRYAHKHIASLLSPQAEEELLDAVRTISPSRIVLFDDGMVSGSTMQDLENLVAGLTELPISRVTIVNRLRETGASINSAKTAQYWRLDLPRLGNSESCIVCRAVRQIESFLEGGITSERGKDRLRNWIELWRGIDPNREWSGQGLRPLPVSRQKFTLGKHREIDKKDDDEVEIEWSTALVIFSAELTAMTGLDDHVDRLIEKLPELDPGVKIELFVTHLVLFFNDLSRELKFRFCQRLLRLICDSPASDSRTSLACLVLSQEIMWQGYDIEKEILKIIAPVSLDLVCLDCDLLFARLISKNILKDKKFYRSSRLLGTSRNALWRVYNDLYDETRGPTGNPHILPLAKLSRGIEGNEEYSRLRGRALDQIDKLLNLLDQLDSRLARPPLSSVDNIDQAGKSVFDEVRTKGVDAAMEERDVSFEKDLSDLSVSLKDLREHIRKDLGGETFNRNATATMRNLGLARCETLLRKFEEFRKQYLFLEFSREELQRGEFEELFIDQVFKQIDWEATMVVKGEQGRSFFKPILERSLSVNMQGAQNVSIVCDVTVVLAFTHILQNSGYGWFEKGTPGPLVKVHSEFFEDRVIVTISNRYEDNVSKIETREGRYTPLREIGGDVEFDTQNGTLQSIMTIPYAGCCSRGI